MERLRDVDLNLLVVLNTLLEAGSVTAAADALGVSQPAVSQKLRRLRETVDDPLFVAVAGGLKPTPRATAMQAPLRRMLDGLVDVVLGEPTFDPASDVAEFVIAAQDLFEVVAVPTILRWLSEHAPRVRLRVVPTNAGTAAQLESGDVDFIIGPHLPDRPGIRRVKLLEDGFVVIARRDHPAMAGRLTLAKYLRARHVIVSPRGAPGTYVDAALARDAKTRDIVAQVSSFLAVPFIVSQGDLFATVPTAVADATEDTIALATAKLPLAIDPVPTFLTWHERFERSPAHAWFRETARRFTARPRGRRSSRAR
ncbi:MAG: LysR family transcriptional regulator [Myxococcota bacterium]